MMMPLFEFLIPNWTPKPKWDPIQNLDSIDLVAEHVSGKIELIIIASQPLDGSEKTKELIAAKFRTYYSIMSSGEFLAEHPNVKNASDIIITMHCQPMIHAKSKVIIEKFKRETEAIGSQFRLIR